MDQHSIGRLDLIRHLTDIRMREIWPETIEVRCWSEYNFNLINHEKYRCPHTSQQPKSNQMPADSRNKDSRLTVKIGEHCFHLID